MDKLTATKYFLKVADAGSFSKAAKKLELPVSTISRRIKDLEHNLGAELFRRSTRFLALTDFGKLYYDQIERAVKDFDAAEQLLDESAKEPSGIIKISALPSYANIHLYPLVHKFKATYPKIVLDLHITDNVDHLLKDKFDFAIRPTSTPPQNLIAKVIDQHKMMLVASPEYIKKHGRICDTNDVKDHKALCFRSPTRIMPWQSYKDGVWRIIEKTPYFICNDTSELLQIAIRGEGVALLPEWTVKSYIRQGLVERINIGWDASFINDVDHRLYLIYDKKTSELKRNRLFLKFFMEHIS